MSEFVILDTVGENYIVGTSKGNIGVIAKSVMEDLDLHPSVTMKACVVAKRTPVCLVPHFPSPRIDTPRSELYPSKTATYEVEEVVLKIHYGDAHYDLFAGYSKCAKTWFYWVG
jgi:hypothetical protein